MARDAVPSIASLIKEVSKKYDLRVGPLSAVADPVVVVSTGNIAIDSAVGVEGLPLGRSVELYGKPGSGKTTTALQTAAVAQQRIITEGLDLHILYLDYEHSLDPEYARSLGLDVDHPSFLLCQPDTLEQGVNAALALIEAGVIQVAVWDSVAAMTPSSESDAEVGTSLPAAQARLMSQFLKKLNPLLHRHNCVAIFVNHEREVMNIGGGGWSGLPQTTSPGGTALKFYASLRLNYKQIKAITAKVRDPILNTDATQQIATEVKVKVVKNKVGPPFRQALVRVRFGKGFDNFWSALQILLGHNQVTRTGAYYYFADELAQADMDVSSTGRVNIHGEEAVLEFADLHPEWREAVIEAARTTLRTAVPPALQVVTSETLGLDEGTSDEPVPAKKPARRAAGKAAVRLITDAEDALGLNADDA